MGWPLLMLLLAVVCASYGRLGDDCDEIRPKPFRHRHNDGSWQYEDSNEVDRNENGKKIIEETDDDVIPSNSTLLDESKNSTDVIRPNRMTTTTPKMIIDEGFVRLLMASIEFFVVRFFVLPVAFPFVLCWLLLQHSMFQGST